MKKEILFSDEQVVRFCKSTHDVNVIHNPEFMLLKRKHVVVPGMLLFSTIVNLLFDNEGRNFDSFRVYFNSVVSSDEPVSIGYEDSLENINAKYLFAFNGRDSFSLKDERSKVYKRNHDINFNFPGIYRNMEIIPEQFEEFKNLVKCYNDELAGFLFAVAYASNALIKTIDNPISDIEKEINRLLDKRLNPDQVSPFYQSLDIFLPKKLEKLKPEGEVEYLVHFEREKLNRVYNAHVRCEQKGRIIFHSAYKLIAVPDKLILRMAKDLN